MVVTLEESLRAFAGRWPRVPPEAGGTRTEVEREPVELPEAVVAGKQRSEGALG